MCIRDRYEGAVYAFHLFRLYMKCLDVDTPCLLQSLLCSFSCKVADGGYSPEYGACPWVWVQAALACPGSRSTPDSIAFKKYKMGSMVQDSEARQLGDKAALFLDNSNGAWSSPGSGLLGRAAGDFSGTGAGPHQHCGAMWTAAGHRTCCIIG